MNEMLLYLGITIVIQLILLILNSIYKNKVAKSSYYISFVLLALIIIIRTRLVWGKLLLFVLIILWAMHYLFIIFEIKNKNHKKSLKFWLIQAGLVWLISLPIIHYLIHDSFKLNVLTIVGLLFWGYGYLLILNPKKFSKYIKPFAKHRHQFAEIFIWSGIYIYVIASIPLIPALISLLSPALIIYTKLK